MKPLRLLALCAPLPAAAALFACVPQVEPPAPAPMPAPTPVARPAPAPAPTPSYANWLDAPRTPGDWFYVQRPPFSYAAYGASESDFVFVMRCDKAKGVISLGRVSAQSGVQPMRIRTETAERVLTAEPRQGAIETLLGADLAARDPLLDAMAISKGRFAVETGGEAPLYIPSWPEVTRLIEDCR